MFYFFFRNQRVRKKVRNNIEAIREAKVGMVTSPTLSDYLWFKWTYIWLATNPQFKTMDLSQYRQVFNSEDPVWEIARLLYWEKRYTKNEKKWYTISVR